jgi:predicted RNase H-like HicB family nuclease
MGWLWRLLFGSDDPAAPLRLAWSRTFSPTCSADAGLRYSMGMELIFEVRDAEEGGYCARALGHGIFTEAETWEELRANVLEAVSVHFEDGPAHPRLVQLHYVKDELIPVEAA